MNVAQVADYWRALVQEPDETFLSNAQVSSLLEQGYNDFRNIVSALDTNYYLATVDVSPSSQTYNLATGAVSILGAAPTNRRMSRLVAVVENAANNPFSQLVWRPTATRSALLNYAAGPDWRRYYLEGSTLYFAINSPPTLTLHYVPVSDVVWTLPSANVFIDDLVEFHDLIALLAARRYHAIDASTNARVDAEIAQRTSDLQVYMSQKRVNEASEIQREVGWY